MVGLMIYEPRSIVALIPVIDFSWRDCCWLLVGVLVRFGERRRKFPSLVESSIAIYNTLKLILEDR